MIFKVSLAQQLEYRIAEAAGQITAAHARAAQSAMKDLAIATYAKAQEMAAQRLHSTRQKYIDNLSFDQAGEGHWMVTLHGDAAYLEEGYGSYDMIKQGLARGPKSKVSKRGYRYVVIPFEHSTKAAGAGHPQHNQPVQIGQPQETTKGSLAQDLKRLKKSFEIPDTYKDVNGNPIYGKVFTVTKNPLSPQWHYKDVLGQHDTANITGKQIHPNLAGLTGIQWEQKLRGGGSRTRTAYMTWRVASENPEVQGKWIHPGFDGARVFPDLEMWAVQQINQRLREIFSGNI